LERGKILSSKIFGIKISGTRYNIYPLPIS
jgi:hypothetical protein